MQKQKVCIIGAGLTGLITAFCLSKLNLEIDLVADDINQNLKSFRTTAISQDNLDFVKKLQIFKINKQNFWPCSKMELYTEDKYKFPKIFQLDNTNSKNKQILYMMENGKVSKKIIEKIKEEKLIKIKNKHKISEIFNSGFLKSINSKEKNNSKYNLIIACVGNSSTLDKFIIDNNIFNHSYGEVSITTVLEHTFSANNTATQIFLNNGILALLPISNTKTSIVWSLKKNSLNKYNDKSYIKNEIKNYVKKFLKNIKFASNIEIRDLNLLIRKKYFDERTLLFGDALHVFHPLAGQGFNMILRDLISLEKILKNKINLGLDIGSSDILSEFSSEIKSRNLAYSLGIDFIKKGFALQKRPIKNFRDQVIKVLDQNYYIKDIFYNIANKGLRF